MKNTYNKDFCTVITEKGQHFLVTPKGERIDGIIFTRVNDDCREVTVCIVKLMVNIKNTEPESKA